MTVVLSVIAMLALVQPILTGIGHYDGARCIALMVL